ncbi:MAG: YbbR-like domain-containing protein [Bilifractor sp.]
MIRRILASLRSNIGYKLLAFLIAIVIWYSVVDINDPVETESYSVHITVANESYISNGKQIYMIEDQYKTVTVYVKGNRSELKKISADNITVTADLTQIVDLDRDPVMVPLSVTVPGISASNVTLSRTAIPITIEDVASKEFAVSVDTGSSVPGSSYEVGIATPNPEKIVINGPESIINEIDSVVAKIDVTGMTQDGNRKAELEIMDKNGEALSQETVQDDLTFDGGVPDVSVYVDLWKKQSGVGMKVEYSGEPAEGYNVTAVSTTPETITVVGTDDALSQLAANGNVITIPEGYVSVSDASSDVTAEVELSDVLPDGLRLASSTAGTVTVTVTILSDETKEFTLDVDDIATNNLDPDLTISYDQTSIQVRLNGAGSVIDDLKTSDIKASIDLKGKDTGDYTVNVSFVLPAGVSLDDEVSIPVHLKEKATASSSSGSDKGGTSS